MDVLRWKQGSLKVTKIAINIASRQKQTDVKTKKKKIETTPSTKLNYVKI